MAIPHTLSATSFDLPEELWLQIFEHVDHLTLWLSLRGTNSQFRRLAEDIAARDLVPHVSIEFSFSLGSGSRHRWYDFRATIHLDFSELSQHNPQYALFDKVTVRPLSCHERAWARWNRICQAGLDGEMEWRVQCGERAEVKGVKLQNSVASHKHGGAWCDWREMLNAYFMKLEPVQS